MLFFPRIPAFLKAQKSSRVASGTELCIEDSIYHKILTLFKVEAGRHNWMIWNFWMRKLDIASSWVILDNQIYLVL